MEKFIFENLLKFAHFYWNWKEYSKLYLNLHLGYIWIWIWKLKIEKGFYLKNFFSSLFGPTSEPAQQPLFPPARAGPLLSAGPMLGAVARSAHLLTARPIPR